MPKTGSSWHGGHHPLKGERAVGTSDAAGPPGLLRLLYSWSGPDLRPRRPVCFEDRLDPADMDRQLSVVMQRLPLGPEVVEGACWPHNVLDRPRDALLNTSSATARLG
jgi:hypothetical protein